MWSNEYTKIPFKDHGRERTGADCWGLVCIVFKERRGIILPSMDDYDNVDDKKKISELIGREKEIWWKKIPVGEEREYDIPVFKMGGLASHVGIVVKPGLMLHCERGSGTYHTEYMIEGQWHRRLEGFYRYAANPSVPSPLSL